MANGGPDQLNGAYTTSAEALKAVGAEFGYWSEKLTDTSFQLSIALIAANWAAFGSVTRVLENVWAKASLAFVILGLGVSLIGAKWMSEAHRCCYENAEGNLSKWEGDFRASIGQRIAWPYTDSIELAGRVLRECKMWLPLGSGVLFLVGLVSS